MVCANLREISRSFLRESSRLRFFVRGVNKKKKVFFLGLICILFKGLVIQLLSVQFGLVVNSIGKSVLFLRFVLCLFCG